MTDIDPIACRRFWRAAVTEKVRTALGASYGAREYEVFKARRWIGTRDFRLHCYCADIDPDRMAEFVRERLASENPAEGLKRIEYVTFGRRAT